MSSSPNFEDNYLRRLRNTKVTSPPNCRLLVREDRINALHALTGDGLLCTEPDGTSKWKYWWCTHPDYGVELSGLGDSRSQLDKPNHIMCLEGYAKSAHLIPTCAPLEEETVIRHLAIKPETRNPGASQHIDRTRQRIKSTVPTLVKKFMERRERALAIRERPARRRAEKLTQRRRDGVSRYFPSADYLETDLDNLQEDLKDAVAWNSDLRQQIEALRSEETMSKYSETMCSNDVYEGAGKHTQILASLRERERDVEESEDYIALLKKEINETREERERRNDIPSKESNDSTPQFTPKASPEDTPEESSDDEGFDEEDDAVDARLSTPDGSHGGQQNDPHQYIVVGDTRASSPLQDSGRSLDRTNGLSAHTANLLALLTGGANRQIREDNHNNQATPNNSTANEDSNGNDENNGHDGGNRGSTTLASQWDSFVDPHFATRDNPRVITYYEERDNKTREETKYHQN